MKFDLLDRSNHPSSWVALASYAVIAIICAYAGYALGKDVSWDQRHFHYFMGFSSLSDRFALDYYPVSVQSYEVPYSYTPFYLLASSGLQDKFVVIALALLHAPALWVVWYVGGRVVGEISGREVNVFGAWLSVGLAAVSPIFLSQLGNSFNDLPTAIPVLLAAALSMNLPALPSRPAVWRAIIAGLLLGAASALKLSNVVSALGVVVMFVLLTPGVWMRLRTAALLGVAGAVSFLAIGGYWWSRVRSEIGNPFPFESLLMQFIQSPAQGEGGVGLGHGRYLPFDLVDALLRPVWMMSPETTLYVDFHAPEVRFFAFYFLLFIALILMFIVVQSGGMNALRSKSSENRRLIAVSAGLVVSWSAWLLTSGNGRYLIPWFLLVGPALIALLWKIIPHLRFRFYALALLFSTQIYFTGVGSQLRYDPKPWSDDGSWYGISLPSALVDRPAVYFSMGVESGSLVFPSMHPGSSFISAGGLKTLSTDMVEWEAVSRRLALLPTRPIFLVYVVDRGMISDGRHVRPDQREIDAMVSGIGMRSKSEPCEDIWVDNAPASISLPPSVVGGVFRLLRRPMLIVACPIESSNVRDSVVEKARVDASALMNRVAQRCPVLFPDPQPFTVYDGTRWVRYFVATDTVLWVNDSEVGFTRHNFYARSFVGSPMKVREGDFSIDCSLRRPSLPKMELK